MRWRPRLSGDWLLHPALPWLAMLGAVALTVGLLLSEFTHRQQVAQDRLVQRTQRLALDLAAAAVQEDGQRLLRQVLRRGVGASADRAVIALDEVVGGVAIPIHRSGPADGTNGWLRNEQTVPLPHRRWVVRVEQPIDAIMDEVAHDPYALITAMLAIPVLCVLFWRLQRQRLDAQAHRSHRFLQTVVDSLPVPIFVKDHEHRYRLVNAAFTQAFNADARMLIGQTSSVLHDTDTARAHSQEDDLVLATQALVVTQQSDCDAQGNRRFWLKRKAPLTLPEGTRGLCGIMTDVSAQRIAEENANNTRAFMEGVLDALPQPMYVRDEQFSLTLVNEAFARLMQRSKADLLGAWDAHCWDPLALERRRAHHREALACDEPVAREEKVILPSGREAWLVTNQRALRTATGENLVIAVMYDVTDLRNTARELEHAHQFLHAIIDALPHSLVVKDEAGHYLIVNRSWCEAVSIDSINVLGRTASDIFPPAIARQLEAQDAEAWATGGTVTAVQPRISLKGESGWSLKSKRVVSLQNGRRFNVQVTTDVTAQHKALHDAQRSRELLSGVLDSIPNPLIVKNAARRYIMINAAASALGGGGRIKIGVSDDDVFDEDTRARYRIEDDQALADAQTRWYSDCRVDAEGRERWWVKSKRAITVSGDERLIVSVLSDVTALKQTERTLIRNQSRLRLLNELSMLMLGHSGFDALCRGAMEALARCLEGCAVSHASVDANGTLVVGASTGAEALAPGTTWRVELSSMPALWHQLRHVEMLDSTEMEGQWSYALWRNAVPAACRDRRTLFLPMMLGSRLAALLLIGSRQDGQWSSHELQVMREAADHLRIACQSHVVAMAQRSAEAALRVSESELRRHRDNLQALVDERTRDLTQAMRAAEIANQSKTQFFNNVSHELRTPMNSIISFAKLGLEKANAGSLSVVVTAQYLQRIERSAGRLLLLINDLLDLAKIEAGRMTYRFVQCDLRKVIDQVCDEFAAMAAKTGVVFQVECEAGHTLAWCDELRMEQVLRNLLANALRHAPASTAVRVALRPSLLATGGSEDDAQGDGDAPSVELLEALEIAVSDEGPGIPPSEFDLIFDKYTQSSRARTGGTGLGLPIAREILRQHRGSIFAANGPRGGAVLTLTLPVSGPSQPDAAPADAIRVGAVT